MRGQSETLGFVLVFALVLSAVALIAVFGFGALEDTRDSEELNNAERAFDVLADNMADIYGQGAPSRATEISLQNAQLNAGEQVTFNVTVVSNTGGSSVVLLTYNPIVFTDGETEIVYSSGAILRNQRSGGLMIKEPPILFGEGNRTVIPVVQTRHTGSVTSTGGQTIRVRAERRQRGPIPELSESPSSFQQLTINMTTPRSDIWQDYFEEEGLTCASTGIENNVRCTLNDPSETFVSRTLIGWEIES